MKVVTQELALYYCNGGGFNFLGHESERKIRHIF
uniref:Uncharacterized protein n=1 Tax=Arundo donax TaxID=35708 RepID=A0A0A9HIM4_ARUDO